MCNRRIEWIQQKLRVPHPSLLANFHYEHIHSLTHAPRDGVERGAQTRTLESETVWGIVGGGVLIEGHRTGILVAKPWGDSDMYDFIVDSGTRLWRVQLKSTAVLQQRGYHVNMMHNAYGKGKVGYKAEDIDMLVVHIPPLEI